MTKKFKKMNLNDKHLYVKHQQLEQQKQEYQKLIRQHKLKYSMPRSLNFIGSTTHQ